MVEENIPSFDQVFEKVLGNKMIPLNHEVPKKIIIDCDTGADDAHAIILALHLSKKFGA
jgi:hypothetical protein